MALPPFNVHSSAEQVLGHLRAMIASGALSGRLPGVLRLEAELGVSRRALMSALATLEREGLVTGARPGGRRRVTENAAAVAARAQRRRGMRVVMLAYDEDDKRAARLLEILHQLRQAGHRADFAAATLTGLGMQVRRVAALVEETAADAWLVVAGSRDILEWFSQRSAPVFAISGRHQRLPVAAAGPLLGPAMETLAHRLVDLGHQRIVLLVHRERREPRPGPSERAFLDALAARGIAVGNYHLPQWTDNSAGFRECLESLFEVTPPTALVLAEPFMYLAAMQFLGDRGLRVPRDLSMACLESDPVFAWSDPEVARIEWDPRRLVRAAVRWVRQVAAGDDARGKSTIKARLIEGGTLGPVPGG